MRSTWGSAGTGSPAPHAVYVADTPAPVFAIVHPPSPASRRPLGVLLCPPFGWEEVSSYRSRRQWAQELAQAGHACLRLTLPATGDSGGTPGDPARLDAWSAAVSASAGWLCESFATERIVAIGLGMGGIAAVRALAAGAPIDDLALWAVPSRGRAIVRELRAFARLETPRFYEGLGPAPPPTDGGLEAGGFLLSPETVAELDSLDLTECSLPRDPSRRVLLLDRDGIAVDQRLREHLEASGASVQLAPGPGYGAMVGHPQTTRPARQVFDLVRDWLEAPRSAAVGENGSEVPDGHSSAVHGEHNSWLGAGVARTAIFRDPVGPVRETPMMIEGAAGRLSAIIAEPIGERTGEVCAVLLNAGAVHRIGPNRMWVEASRRWAARGVPTVRLDITGVGDSDGDSSPYVDDAALYIPELVPEVLGVLDELQAKGLGKRFLLAGLCSGAYWAFQAALIDSRVVGIMMLNPRALVWDPGLDPARDLKALITRPSSWRKIRSGASLRRTLALVRWIISSLVALLTGRRQRSRQDRDEDVGMLLEQLHRSGKRALLLFAEGEPLFEELESEGALTDFDGDQLSIERIPVRDHTLRPVWAQRQVHEILDRHLDRICSAPVGDHSDQPEPSAA